MKKQDIRLITVIGCIYLALALLSLLFVPNYAKAQPKPKYGGTLRILTNYRLTNIGDPRAIGSTSTSNAQMAVPSIETLVRPDEKGQPIPWLATGWKWTDDYKSITFTLRKGVKYHDGTDFNARSVKECLDMSRASPVNQGLSGITSIDVVDDYTVRLNLKGYSDDFLTGLYEGGGWMVSPTALKTQSKEWIATHPVGTGPFKIVSFERDVGIKWEKNKDYWLQGRPYLDGINYKMIADYTTSVLALESGEGDLHTWILGADMDRMQKTTPGKYVVVGPWVGVDGFIFDSANRDSPFADVRVRRAFWHAIDARAINEGLGYGLWIPNNQPCNNQFWAWNPDVKGYPYDPKKAKQLLAEAGYPSGFKTVVHLNPGVYSKDIVVAAQNYLTAVGIDMDINLVTGVGDTELSTKGWKGLRYNFMGTDLARQPIAFLRDNFSEVSPYNRSTSYPPMYTAKLLASLAEPDFAKRQALAREAMKILIDDYCAVHLMMQVKSVQVRYPYVKGANFKEFWSRQWTPEQAWLDK